jgi:hypothetical protein
MAPVTGGGNRKGEAIGCGCFWKRRGHSMVPEVNETAKSG